MSGSHPGVLQKQAQSTALFLGSPSLGPLLGPLSPDSHRHCCLCSSKILRSMSNVFTQNHPTTFYIPTLLLFKSFKHPMVVCLWGMGEGREKIRHRKAAIPGCIWGLRILKEKEGGGESQGGTKRAKRQSLFSFPLKLKCLILFLLPPPGDPSRSLLLALCPWHSLFLSTFTQILSTSASYHTGSHQRKRTAMSLKCQLMEFLSS